MERLTPEEARFRYGPEAERMIFPHTVVMPISDRLEVVFPAGSHLVPWRLVDHPALKANQVERVAWRV